MAVFINEFHYDSSAANDFPEFIEIAATAGTSLNGWSIVLYNGSTPGAATTYNPLIQLSGTVADPDGDGFGFFDYRFAGVTNGAFQNGGNDGMALVRPDGSVAQLLSYEGVFTASNGPAAGQTSVDVGVAETNSTSATASLSLTGTGSDYADFRWRVTEVATEGTANSGQIFTGGGTPALPTFSIGDVSQNEGDAGSSSFVFTVTRSSSIGASSVAYATADNTATAGSDYVATSGTLTFADGQSTATVAVTVNGDMVAEGNETFFLNLTNPTGATIADAQGIGTIVNDDQSSALTLVHDIQGSAFFSPILAGEGIAAYNVRSAQLVTVQAVVTAIDDAGARQGFFLAEEQGQWDANPLTSEGIFVMTRNDNNVGQTFAAAAAGVTVGETVTVSAYVMEYQAFATQARTFLVNPTIVAQANDTVALPTLVLDGSPGKAIPNAILTSETPNYFDSADDANDTFTPQTDALDFLETIEGMRVSIPNMVVADGFVTLTGGEPYFKAYSTNFANPESINSRGGYTIAGDPPLSPPNTPETDDNTRQGGKSINDGDVNPDVLELDFTGAGLGAQPGLVNLLSMGDKLGTVTGVFDYDFATAKLYVTDPVTLVDTQPTQEVLGLADDARSLRVATFNVENLDPTDGAARFQALANAVATNLKSPDILSIEEIQDNNGAAAGDGRSATGTDASQTWQMLTDAVNLATGKHYQWVDELPTYNAEGGELSGNIRVGFLYNTDRVQLGDLAPDATIAERRQFTDRIGDGQRDAGDRIAFSDAQIADQISAADYTATRKSLLGEFSFNGNDVYVVANHLPSKGGSGTMWALDQSDGQPENAGWAKRNAIADDVYRMLDTISSGDANARVISGGDYNDFYFYRPLEVVTGYVNPDGTARTGGARFDNLTVTDLPEAERYTYAFGGNSQAIDHIVVDQVLGSVSSYDVVHINTGFNSQGGVNPALSDHDPAVAQFDLRSLAERLTGTAADDALEGFGGADTLLGGAGNDNLTGGIGDDRLDGGAGTDVALFSGLRAEYSAAHGENGAIIVVDSIAGRDGADMLISVEQVGFADGTVIAADQLLLGVTRTGTLGKDTLSGGALDDKLYGYAQNDVLNGFDGWDSLWGGQGNDTLIGGLGNDKLHGGAADDSVQGGTGDDYIVGGLGNDRLEGGDGSDIFFFGRAEGRDILVDYVVGQDSIHLAQGVTIAGTAVGDYNSDGRADLVMTLTGGGQVTVYGVSSTAALTIAYNQTALITDVG